MEEPAPQASSPRNGVDRAIEAIARLLSYSFALSIVVTIYDVICDVVFHSPTIWVYDVVTTAIAVSFLIGGFFFPVGRAQNPLSSPFFRFFPRPRPRGVIVMSVRALFFFGGFCWFGFNIGSLFT